MSTITNGTLYSLVEWHGRFFARFYRPNGNGWKTVEHEVSERAFTKLAVANHRRLDPDHSDTVIRIYGETAMA